MNNGVDCLQKCNNKIGKCYWCGTGYCCKLGEKGNGCDGIMGHPEIYTCSHSKWQVSGIRYVLSTYQWRIIG